MKSLPVFTFPKVSWHGPSSKKIESVGGYCGCSSFRVINSFSCGRRIGPSKESEIVHHVDKHCQNEQRG